MPFEIFINAPQQVRRYFEEEHAAARPISAHILSMGFVVLDHDPAVQELRAEAAEWLPMPPAPGDDALRWRRYAIADELDNASDVLADRHVTPEAMTYDGCPQLELHPTFRRHVTPEAMTYDGCPQLELHPAFSAKLEISNHVKLGDTLRPAGHSAMSSPARRRTCPARSPASGHGCASIRPESS